MVFLRFLAVTALLITPAAAQEGPDLNDIPAKIVKNTAGYDYDKRVVMIPMRDGVKLYTVLMIPKGAHDAPMVMTRTPYNAAKRAQAMETPYRAVALAHSDELLTDDGYIRIFQDVRGKYGSEGNFVFTRPVRGSLNPTKTDETTDAWDTIDWLVKHVPESNGRVGMVGSSYEGFTVVMALLDPHPALKVTAPESPMIDGWMGDDWFHYGAFRQNNLDFITSESSARGEGEDVPREIYDDYDGYLRAGSVDGWAKAHGVDQYPYYQREVRHAAYDAFWQIRGSGFGGLVYWVSCVFRTADTALTVFEFATRPGFPGGNGGQPSLRVYRMAVAPLAFTDSNRRLRDRHFLIEFFGTDGAPLYFCLGVAKLRGRGAPDGIWQHSGFHQFQQHPSSGVRSAVSLSRICRERYQWGLDS